jgi:hypothetical protein
MTKNEAPYLLYLGDVGRNWATFAVFTQLVRMIDNHEIRRPSLCDVQRVNSAIESLDRGPVPITTWRDFFTWLGRGHGWATFSQKSAKEIVPHWLSDEAEWEYESVESAFPPFKFIERNLTIGKFSFDEVAEPLEEIVGPSPDDGAQWWLVQIMGNMVVSRRPIFVAQPSGALNHAG